MPLQLYAIRKFYVLKTIKLRICALSRLIQQLNFASFQLWNLKLEWTQDILITNTPEIHCFLSFLQ